MKTNVILSSLLGAALARHLGPRSMDRQLVHRRDTPSQWRNHAPGGGWRLVGQTVEGARDAVAGIITAPFGGTEESTKTGEPGNKGKGGSTTWVLGFQNDPDPKHEEHLATKVQNQGFPDQWQVRGYSNYHCVMDRSCLDNIKKKIEEKLAECNKRKEAECPKGSKGHNIHPTCQYWCDYERIRARDEATSIARNMHPEPPPKPREPKKAQPKQPPPTKEDAKPTPTEKMDQPSEEDTGSRWKFWKNWKFCARSCGPGTKEYYRQ
ncbi:hypothetical protein GQ602_005489 [Ophiocordyceps camponoti-floridani]|uniref:Uncharacterized protein n=1 Tax=Ophiocordyceps camponoti-floridani TaxID=2030778 RepID=A0A8H4Q3E0_9HYPO|nr:hypothetical protein GQ602_005489 [Ophiocordyceps camponoti-floridani]